MKSFNWTHTKNQWLIKERDISFDDILFYILKGQLLDNVEHPNRDKYPNQRMFIVEVDNYAYLVPYVESDEEIFLKTIIPSRKATKHYLRG